MKNYSDYPLMAILVFLCVPCVHFFEHFAGSAVFLPQTCPALAGEHEASAKNTKIYYYLQLG